jgi:hypothetical protein
MSDLKERAGRVLTAWEDLERYEGRTQEKELEAAEKALVPGLEWPDHDVSRRLATEIVEAVAAEHRRVLAETALCIGGGGRGEGCGLTEQQSGETCKHCNGMVLSIACLQLAQTLSLKEKG